MAITQVPGYGAKAGQLQHLENALRLTGKPKPPLAQQYVAPPVGTTPATKAALLPYTEGSLGLPGVPAASPPSFAVPMADPINPETPPNENDSRNVPQNYDITLEEIYNHPLYQAALQQMKDMNQTDYNALIDTIKSQIISKGYDPTQYLTEHGRADLIPYLVGVTPAVRELMASNQLSDRAQIEKARQNAITDLQYRQNAQGTLASGATTAGGSLIADQTNVAQNKALAELVNAIGSGVGGLATNQFNRQQALSGTMSDVASLLAQQKGAVYPTGSITPAEVAAVGGQAGDSLTTIINNAIAAAQGGKTPATTIPGTNVQSAQTPIGVPWGGKTWYSKADLAQWLRDRGVRYDDWARTHREADARLV